MKRPRSVLLTLLALAACAVCSASRPQRVSAQSSEAASTGPRMVHLEQLRAAAARQDPRALQPELLDRAARLQIAALRAQRRPQLSFNGQFTIQSDVPEIPLDLPGQALPNPPREQFGAEIETNWMLYDGGRLEQLAAVQDARLEENIAGAAAALYGLREAATEAFFGALLSRAQSRTLALAAQDLEARLQVVRQQAEYGTALPAASAALEADLIRVRQQIEESNASRRAALGVLARLTDTAIRTSDSLLLPNVDEEIAHVLRQLGVKPSESADRPGETALENLLDRPELEQISHTAERLMAEARVREAQSRPSLTLFGQAGIGRPSPFNFISDELSEYGRAGVRLNWSIVDWKRAERETRALRVQARIAQTEAAAFTRRVARAMADNLAHLARLRTTIEEDQHMIELRSSALGAARHQLEEGVVLVDVYTERLSDLAEARMALHRHRIERVQTQVSLLSVLGRYPERRLLSGANTNEDPNLK